MTLDPDLALVNGSAAMSYELERQRPRFAICLAAYNGTAYIVEQIESILKQTGVDLRLFVSVDESSDGTENLLAEWALTESRLTLLPFGHRFGGAAPNFYRLLRDIDLTGFDYLSFADQDDVWCSSKLSRAHRLMVDQGATGYSSNFTAFWSSGQNQLVKKAWPQKDWDYLFESAGPGCTYVLHASLAIVLQELVRKADASLLRIDYHDWLIYAFARFHNFTWIIDNWSSMKYRQHAHNQLGVNAGWRSFLLRARKILSGYGFQQSLLIANLIHASSLPIVQRGLQHGRSGYFWLALRARRCRRRPGDQFWFFASCVLVAAFKSAGRAET